MRFAMQPIICMCSLMCSTYLPLQRIVGQNSQNHMLPCILKICAQMQFGILIFLAYCIWHAMYWDVLNSISVGMQPPGVNTKMAMSSYLWLSCSISDKSLTFSASCTFSLSPSISFLSSSTSV